MLIAEPAVQGSLVGVFVELEKLLSARSDLFALPPPSIVSSAPSGGAHDRTCLQGVFGLGRVFDLLSIALLVVTWALVCALARFVGRRPSLSEPSISFSHTLSDCFAAIIRSSIMVWIHGWCWESSKTYMSGIEEI